MLKIRFFFFVLDYDKGTNLGSRGFGKNKNYQSPARYGNPSLERLKLLKNRLK